MPRLSDDQIKTLIAEGGVFAISIDTAVFDGKLKSFQNAVLRRLDQFQERDIHFVIVDVIAEEMKAHLRDEAVETQRALKKALRAHSNRWRREAPEGEGAALLIDADAAKFAQAEIDEFLAHVHGEVIRVGDTPNAVTKIFDRYFAEEPPFGSADKRKSEFPDAFALLRLRGRARQGFNLCISRQRLDRIR